MLLSHVSIRRRVRLTKRAFDPVHDPETFWNDGPAIVWRILIEDEITAERPRVKKAAALQSLLIIRAGKAGR